MSANNIGAAGVALQKTKELEGKVQQLHERLADQESDLDAALLQIKQVSEKLRQVAEGLRIASLGGVARPTQPGLPSGHAEKQDPGK